MIQADSYGLGGIIEYVYGVKPLATTAILFADLLSDSQCPVSVGVRTAAPVSLLDVAEDDAISTGHLMFFLTEGCGYVLQLAP